MRTDDWESEAAHWFEYAQKLEDDNRWLRERLWGMIAWVTEVRETQAFALDLIERKFGTNGSSSAGEPARTHPARISSS